MKRRVSVGVKQSPIVIVRNFLVMEVAGYALFVFLGVLADYGAIYAGTPLGGFLSYDAARFLGIVLSEMALTFFIFLDWFYAYYRITENAVMWSGGVIWRRKVTVPVESVILASAEYGLLGKIFDFGTLKIAVTGGGELKMRWIKNPQKYADLIARIKGGRADDNPGFQSVKNPAELLGKEESEQLEFKSSLRWDSRMGEPSRHLEKAVMKTIAAFLNSGGGHLIIGVDDKGKPVGLAEDYGSLRRPDQDGFENHFTNVFNSVIGAEFRQFIRLHFPKVGEKEVCVVEVAPAARPVFLRFDNASEEFYIRTGNSTTALKMSEAAVYLEERRSRTA